MSEFNAETEVNVLKQQTKTIRKPRFYKSRLDKFKGELLQLYEKGATIAELRRWLRAKRIKVEWSTVKRWIKKNATIKE